MVGVQFADFLPLIPSIPSVIIIPSKPSAAAALLDSTYLFKLHISDIEKGLSEENTLWLGSKVDDDRNWVQGVGPWKSLEKLGRYADPVRAVAVFDGKTPSIERFLIAAYSVDSKTYSNKVSKRPRSTSFKDSITGQVSQNSVPKLMELLAFAASEATLSVFDYLKQFADQSMRAAEVWGGVHFVSSV